jgi:hypothetical protein
MRRSLSYVLFAAAALIATIALAEVKKGGGARVTRRPVSASKDAGTGENPYEKGDAPPGKGTGTASGSDGGSPGSEAVAASGADAAEPSGESPGAQAAGSDEAVRSSPLNPRPEEFPDGGAGISSIDLDKILGEIAALRARVAVVSDTLFHSRVVLRVETRGDHARIAKLVVTLDEGVVYTAPAGFRAEDETTVYDHAVAPGRHLLGLSVERRDDRGDSYRNTQQSQVALDVPENERLEATIRIDDDSDMATDFPSGKKGSYDLRVRVRAKVRH